MAEKKDKFTVECEERIAALETELAQLRGQVEFFVEPLVLSVFTDAHGATPIPPIMHWVARRFYDAKTLDEKKVLKANFDKLKNEIPMERSALVDLPEVREPAVDMSVFEK